MSEETQSPYKTMSTPSKLKGRAPETVKPGKIKAVLFGVAGIGKTTVALSFPSPYYFDVEGGAKGPQYRDLLKASGGAYMGPEDGTLSFDTLIEQMKALSSEKHGFKTLIVDSLTKLFQTAIATEAERLGSADAFGASKKPAIAAMRRMLMWANRLDMNIWFICHEAAEWGLVNGQRAEIGRVADVWDKTIYELDLAVQAVKTGPARFAIVKKSRLSGFPDNERFALDYSEFAKRHGKDLVEAPSEPVALVTPDQAKELRSLAAALAMTPAAIEKTLAARSVETWEDLRADAAAEILVKMRIAAAPILAARKADAPDFEPAS